MKRRLWIFGALVFTHAVMVWWGFSWQSAAQLSKANSYRLNVTPGILLGQYFAGQQNLPSPETKKAARHAHSLIVDTLDSADLTSSETKKLSELENRL